MMQDIFEKILATIQGSNYLFHTLVKSFIHQNTITFSTPLGYTKYKIQIKNGMLPLKRFPTHCLSSIFVGAPQNSILLLIFTGYIKTAVFMTFIFSSLIDISHHLIFVTFYGFHIFISN